MRGLNHAEKSLLEQCPLVGTHYCPTTDDEMTPEEIVTGNILRERGLVIEVTMPTFDVENGHVSWIVLFRTHLGDIALRVNNLSLHSRAA